MIVEFTGGEQPIQAKPHDAGYDLKASESKTVFPGETTLIKTGLAIAIPEGYAGLICSRSGLALKQSVFVLNAPGVIDATYRGDVGVIIHNAGSDPFKVEKGDRIAQILFMSVAHPIFASVFQLSETDRGVGGFGSTGQ